MNADSPRWYRGFAPGALVSVGIGIAQGVIAGGFLFDSTSGEDPTMERALAVAIIAASLAVVGCSLWSRISSRAIPWIPVIGAAWAIFFALVTAGFDPEEDRFHLASADFARVLAWAFVPSLIACGTAWLATVARRRGWPRSLRGRQSATAVDGFVAIALVYVAFVFSLISNVH
jgi:hypothetical protein